MAPRWTADHAFHHLSEGDDCQVIGKVTSEDRSLLRLQPVPRLVGRPPVNLAETWTEAE